MSYSKTKFELLKETSCIKSGKCRKCGKSDKKQKCCPKYFIDFDELYPEYVKPDINLNDTGINNPFYGWWRINTPSSTFITNNFNSNSRRVIPYIFMDTTNTNGYIQSIPIVTGGSGYTTPTITISAPGAGGIQATATITVVAGVITAITLTNKGSNYLNPTITITGTNTTSAVLGSPVIIPMVLITQYIGTPEMPRPGSANYDLNTTPNTAKCWFQSTTELVENVDLNGPSPNISRVYNGVSYKLVNDFNTINCSIITQPGYAIDLPTLTIYKRVKFPAPTIVPSFQDDTLFLARYIINLWKWFANQSQINKECKDPDFVGIRQANKIIRKFFTTGFKQTTPIRAIGCSSLNSYLNQYTEKLTDIYTGEKSTGLGIFSYATPGSTVEITGFTGVWSAMNGIYKNGVAIVEAGGVPNVDPARNDCGPNGSFHNHFNHFLLNFDSSNRLLYPCNSITLLSDFTGKPTITVCHKFTADMEYPEFIAALTAINYSIFRAGTHNLMDNYIQSNTSLRMCNSWNDLKIRLSTNTATIRDLFRINQCKVGMFYQNAVLSNNSPIQFRYNESFNFQPITGNTADYSLDMYNYLSEIRVLYFGIQGTLQADQPNPVTFSYPAVIPGPNRATFVGVLGNVNLVAGRPVPVNPDSTKYKLMGGSSNDSLNAQNYYFGIINPQYTNGKKLGYIRWFDCNYADSLGYMCSGLYAPENPATSTNPRNARESFSAVLSVMMSYFTTTQNVDNIIIDIRSNTGGNSNRPQALAEFFGSDRSNFKLYVNKTPDINNPLISANSLSTVNNGLSIYDSNNNSIYVSLNSIKYPGSVMNKGTINNPNQVIILTDNICFSAGDVFPNLFLGDLKDGNIGNNTRGVIIGSINGQLKGNSIGPFNMPLPIDSFGIKYKNSSGNPVSIYLPGFDGSNAGSRIYNNNINLVQISKGLFPNKVPGITGTSGSNALPESWYDTICYDVGGLTPYPEPRLPGDIRPMNPVFTDRSTWRDRWLESAIRQCLFGTINNNYTQYSLKDTKELRKKMAGEYLSMDCNGKIIYKPGFEHNKCNNKYYNTYYNLC
jgi:hypothetical protein